MATFIPHPSDDENRLRLSLEQAKDFASRFCQPEDNDLVEDFDESAREAAWQLLQALEQVQHQECNEFVCEKCKEKEEEQSIDEDGAVENEEETVESNEPIVGEAEKPSTIEKLNEIAENNKELIKKATGTVAGAGVAVATTQAAAAEIAAPTIKASVISFVQETSSKVAAIGTAGVMSIGSGAYFQAKTAKAEGMEVAVITEQEYGAFSKFSGFTQSLLGVTTFDNVRKYAEEGYGDVEGTGPIKDKEMTAEEKLAEEEQSKRAEEASKLRKELDEKGILKIEDDELEKDEAVTPVPKVTDL
tara:strand:+ start:444 stop:1352 length:909 start_codon:yes stop_codon:yes gene_type:complete